ncbi:hypothetical protein [Amycolatopsis sp. SID8362]|uniref:hypothetical protein n=1 Tax=Amycolatopsis sp. SID8362 TaxID=2690346 RepID=UPI00136DA753|nr:hypothetical protein [Amycolatopsis sp. SID8362]NBH02875.1 hypothetical protein [Amycolatopsis sp. SID8362]NED39576.1 hypothetical protein [Amycolatopsis sp. SID8362]
MDNGATPRFTEAYLADIAKDLDALVWRFALPMTRLKPGTPITGAGPDDEDIAKAFLARASIFTLLRENVKTGIDRDIRKAIHHGADLEDVVAALGITRQAVAKRWGSSLRGYAQRDRMSSVAVVISRRARVHHDGNDPRGRYGEVGGAEQYASDRGAWPVGKLVREMARYAIIAVDGTVARIYRINHDGWQQTANGKWQFTAIGGRECTPEEINAAHAAEQLPLRLGDSCPTRAGGAYRPLWFGAPWPSLYAYRAEH